MNTHHEEQRSCFPRTFLVFLFSFKVRADTVGYPPVQRTKLTGPQKQ